MNLNEATGLPEQIRYIVSYFEKASQSGSTIDNADLLKLADIIEALIEENDQLVCENLVLENELKNQSV